MPYLADVAAIYRQEIADLYAAGCRYLQVDEVPLAVLCDPKNQDIVAQRGEDPAELIRQYADLIAAVVQDRPPDMAVVVHMCRGNWGLGQASGGYEPIAEAVFARLPVDGYLLEYDDHELPGAGAQARARGEPRGADLGLRRPGGLGFGTGARAVWPDRPTPGRGLDPGRGAQCGRCTPGRPRAG